MAYEEVEELIGRVPGGYLSILVAFTVGLLGVVLLCWTRRSSKKEAVLQGGGNDESKGSDSETNLKNHESKSKGVKPKQGHASKKALLPSHPLLAAEFKGHTSSILSLDFDTNGKYLGSCSDGMLIHGGVLI